MKAKTILRIIFTVAIWGLSATAGYPTTEIRDAGLITFGQGPVEVRLYSDYFCPPCRALEPQVEPLLKDLLKRRAIRLTMVDTPMNRNTALYARYFLYALKENADVMHAFRVRQVLLMAAGKALSRPEELEAIFAENAIPFKVFDIKPVTDVMNGLFRADSINATPTCVVIQGGKKTTYIGGTDILNALKALP